MHLAKQVFLCKMIQMLVLINVLWTLTVTVTGIEKVKGELVVAVYDSEENFMDGHKLHTYRYIEVKKPGQLSFDMELPEGAYAISVYHDRNGNKKLNRYLIGVPREPYGFSNNIRPLLRAPDFSETVFEICDDSRISIHLE